MRILLQRVKSASVSVAGETIGRTGPGLLLLVGIGKTDTEATLDAMIYKVLYLRIFADELGKMNLSLLDTGGGILAVSQFTLYADCRKGRRPSFIEAADPETGSRLFECFVAKLGTHVSHVETGRFGAMMDVELVNDGPVTIWLDSDVMGLINPT